MQLRVPTLAAVPLLLAACVAGDGRPSHLTPTAVATNGPAACYAQASFAPEEHRIPTTHSTVLTPMGDYVACQQARQELAQRSSEICQASYGGRTDIRNLTARTQFNAAPTNCHCIELSELFIQCTVDGDAICAFEAAKPGSGTC